MKRGNERVRFVRVARCTLDRRVRKDRSTLPAFVDGEEENERIIKERRRYGGGE